MLAAGGLLGAVPAFGQPRRPHILWRNGWNLNNIGDIGHVPGALALLKRYVPEARVTLWANNDLVFRGDLAKAAGFDDGTVDAGRIHRRIMPDMGLVTGKVDAQGRGDNPALEAAVASADIMVIGSGAGVLEAAALNAFRRRTGQPTGMFGITTDPFNFTYFEAGSADREALQQANFVFTREWTSLRVLAGQDVDGPGGAQADDPATPVNEAINRVAVSLPGMRSRPAFVPDTTFAFTARDDAAALAWMQAQGLTAGRFACFVPRYRWTPYTTPTRQGNSRAVYNALYTRADHSKLQAAIVDYVRATGHHVAIVPETVQVVGQLDALLKDGLPPDVAAKVVTMDRYWLPDMAASLFARATVVVSIENHSPILAAAAGTPFVMVHQPEDSFKSDMFTDIGLGDWHIRDVGRASGADVSRAVMGIVREPAAARRKLARAMTQVETRHRAGMLTLRRTLGLR
ncbi:polysaccharide pyruvyl transferase family protein [Glacieibacterium frigidum]|uniref:Polysaccharide pyruvyl transferase family protein n=1 Tax=Glacieibacterium frigidum TaxID=2593303 RepID=A0A552UGI2_9SPHN|nr:polysaccharide pyruvyl transferase family protein [Glacieibacterium frigidum]TRW17320.1 polysaccharide pyruvyl transferase family protein [Glacieibacterium frigidum]